MTDEPMMPGSDDEFSDYDLEEEDNIASEEENDQQTTPPFPTQQATTNAPLPTNWTSLTIGDFKSSVGPTVPVPETASEVFGLMFTPSFLDTIVEQSNLYARQVMGEEKYASWKS